MRVGDKVLTRNNTRAGKLDNYWLSDIYEVVYQQDAGIPVYEIRKEGEDCTPFLHRNLLLPLTSIHAADDSSTDSEACQEDSDSMSSQDFHLELSETESDCEAAVSHRPARIRRASDCLSL